MSNLSIGISPGPRDTRVLAMTGPSDTILKARRIHPVTPIYSGALAAVIVLCGGDANGRGSGAHG